MQILFVDDDAMNRRVVRDMLQVVGVPLDEAPDGQTGLNLIDSGDYAVVLMDLRMPGMDGLEAIGHIRNRGDAKGRVPIIVVTADTSLNIREECLAAGANDLMMKPVAMQHLFKVLGEVVATQGKP